MLKFKSMAIVMVVSGLSTVTLADEGDKMIQDQMDVLAVIEKMTASFQSGDIDAVMRSYEPNAKISFEPGKPVSDPKLARAMFEGASAMKPTFTYAGHEVIVEGGTAVHLAPWTMTATGPDGSKIEQSGLSVAVLRRQPDGGWRMIIDNPHGQRLMK